MKKNLGFVLLFVIISSAFLVIPAYFNSDRYKIQSLKADIEIEANGDMVISERWVVQYPEGYSVSYRDISYQKYNPNNPFNQEKTNQAGFEIDLENDVWVAGSDGKKLARNSYYVRTSGELDERGEIIECYPNRSQCESIFIRVPSGFDKEMTFGYKYRIKGAVTEYRDVAELNWVFLDYFEATVRNVEFSITLPGILKDDILAWGHGTDGSLEIKENKVLVSVDKLKKKEVLEVRILMPNEKFSVPENNYINRTVKQDIIDYEMELAEETNRRIEIAQWVFYGTFAMLALMIVMVYIAYVKYDKEHTPRFTGKYYRELPAKYSPAEMSYLYYFRKINNEDLTATLLDLIRRKYLIFDQNKQGINDKNPDFKLILNPDMDHSDLRSHEKHLLNWFIGIIGNKQEVTLKEIENYPKHSYSNAMSFQNNAKEFVRRAKLEGSRHDFFEKRLGKEKSKMLLATIIPGFYALLSLVLRLNYFVDTNFALGTSIIALIVYIFYIATIDKRSINGNEDYVKWKAFRQFLLDFGNMKDYPIPGIVVWEHYLVYATSLKVADKVMKQLEVRLPKTVDEESLHGSTFLGFGYYYPRYHLWYTFGRINNSMTLARQNVHQTIVKHTSQKIGGSGRGGGFGGGRSFGGGGGGFRSR